MFTQKYLHLNFEQLALIETNSQKFQQTYLQEQPLLTSPETKQRKEMGNAFHLVMKQMLLGLLVQPILDAHPLIKLWVENLQTAAPTSLNLHQTILLESANTHAP